MQGQRHIRHATSRFTGKERDTESGNDYFGARYYASSMGRWLSPDWSAKEEPIPYAKMDDPQSLNLYLYLRDNPLAGIDVDGHEIVQLGQHTDKEIDARTKEISTKLKDKSLSGDARNALKAERTTLGIEKQGNHVASAYLARLDSVGQRHGLTLKNIAVTTDPAHDFAGDPRVGQMTDPLTQAFTPNPGGPLYLKTSAFIYTNAFNLTSGLQVQDLGASVLRHEQVHIGGGGEVRAYETQREVFEHFRPDFNSMPEVYEDWYNKMVPPQ